MNITLQQQYNYLNWRRRVVQLYRQQLLTESLQGSQSGAMNGYTPAGQSSLSKDKIYKLKAIDTETGGHYPFLFYYESDGSYDIATQNQGYLKYQWKKGQSAFNASVQRSRHSRSCSSFTKGKFHARNYDWNYDGAPEIVVKIPHGVDKQGHERFASLNIAHLDMLNKDLVDGDNKWNPQFDMLESTVMDGINEYGLSYNTNVVPVGDNPLHPDGQYPEGTSAEIKHNITYCTSPQLKQTPLFIRCMLRMALDYCKDVDDAIDMVQSHSWFAARNPEQPFIEEFHLMMHDASNKTIIVEFVENEVVIHKWSNDGTYECITDHKDKDKLKVADNAIPMMTNFYISGWDGDVSSIDMNKQKDLRSKSLTKYPAGTERYVEMWNDYRSIEGIESVRNAIQKAWYRRAYRDRAPVDTIQGNFYWWSEFVADYSHSEPPADQLGDFNFRCEDISKQMFAKFMPVLAKIAVAEDEQFNLNDVRPSGKDVQTWQTVHSTIYDKTDDSEYTMLIQTQEDKDHTYRFQLAKAK